MLVIRVIGDDPGWWHIRPSTAEGVTTGEAFLSGHAHAAGVGWMGFGDGTPDNVGIADPWEYVVFGGLTAANGTSNHGGLRRSTGRERGLRRQDGTPRIGAES